MKPPLYQVVNFSEAHENYKSRNIDRCSWIATSVDWDMQWANVMSQGLRGAATMGIFGSLLQMLGRQRKPRLGFFTHDGKKDGRRHTLAELGMVLYQTEDLMVSAFEILTSPEVNWISVIDPASTSIGPREDLALTSIGPREDLALTSIGPREVSVIEDRKTVQEERTLNGSLAPKSSTETKDPIQHSEAKQLLGKLSEDVFNTPLRDNQWSQKWDYLLSQALPMKREDWAEIDRFYRLPSNHQIFTVTRKRQSMGTLIENLMDEPMKIRSAWAAIGRNGTKPSEPEPLPPEWVATIRKIYGPDVYVPDKKKDLPPSVRVEVEEALNGATSKTG